MPRQSKPFFRKQTQSWYFSTKGKQIPLGKDREKAFKKFYELMARDAPTKASDSVAKLCNLYLDWCKQNRSKRTYDSYRMYLSSLIRSVGTSLTIADLKPMHISRWLDENPTWNATSKNTATRYAKRVFNWAKKEGRLEANPIQLAEAPSPKRREHAITPEQHELVMSFSRDQEFKDCLLFLYETGARPQEARVIEAGHCHIDVQRIVLPPSDAKGEEDFRVIRLPKTKIRKLLHLRVRFDEAISHGCSRKGPWRMSGSRALQMGMSFEWLTVRGLVNLEGIWIRFAPKR